MGERFPVEGRVTSIGDMSGCGGRGCSLATCVERRFIGTWMPQKRHKAVPGEMWICIHLQLDRCRRASQALGALGTHRNSLTELQPAVARCHHELPQLERKRGGHSAGYHTLGEPRVPFVLIALLSAAFLFIGMLILSEVGRRIGIARLRRDSAGLVKGADAAETAVFALLGLLIAFTFSGAASRFEDRRHLVAAEANAIGTAYLRIDLLPGDAQPEIRKLFLRYLDARTAAYRNAEDLAGSQARLDEAVALQRDIWTKAWAACKRPEAPAQAAMLLLPALNEMIDITTTREVATQNHPPFVVFYLLAGLGLVGAMLVGYGTSPNKDRSWLHTVIFAGILSLTFYVIVDIEFPRYGLIRIDAADQVLFNLRQSMQ